MHYSQNSDKIERGVDCIHWWLCSTTLLRHRLKNIISYYLSMSYARKKCQNFSWNYIFLLKQKHRTMLSKVLIYVDIVRPSALKVMVMCYCVGALSTLNFNLKVCEKVVGDYILIEFVSSFWCREIYWCFDNISGYVGIKFSVFLKNFHPHGTSYYILAKSKQDRFSREKLTENIYQYKLVFYSFSLWV